MKYFILGALAAAGLYLYFKPRYQPAVQGMPVFSNARYRGIIPDPYLQSLIDQLERDRARSTSTNS